MKQLRQKRLKARMKRAWKGETVRVTYLKMICISACAVYPTIA
jgi:hypothetical protein